MNIAKIKGTHKKRQKQNKKGKKKRTGKHILQSLSSDPSPQSGIPSQR